MAAGCCFCNVGSNTEDRITTGYITTLMLLIDDLTWRVLRAGQVRGELSSKYV